VIASPVSYLTGASKSQPSPSNQGIGTGVKVIRAYTYQALHKSFVHRVLAFVSFMVSSFFAGLGVRNVDVVWGTSPPIFQGWTAWMLAWLKGARFLFEVRDLWPQFAIAVGVLTNRTLIRMSLWLERFLYRHADRVMAAATSRSDRIRSGETRLLRRPNVGIDSICVYTNLPPGGPYRGFGYSEFFFGLESHVNRLAKKVKAGRIMLAHLAPLRKSP